MRLPLKFTIISLLLFLTLSLVSAVSAGFWIFSKELAEDVASDVFRNQSRIATDNLENLLEDALTLAALGANHEAMGRLPEFAPTASFLPWLTTSLERNPSLYSLYFGLNTGDFFQVIATRDNANILTSHDAPNNTKWILRHIQSDETAPKSVTDWFYLDASLQLLGRARDEATDYDPRMRPWFLNAETTQQTLISRPYLFHSLQQPGITASRQIASGLGVFGVDLTLDGLAREISHNGLSEHGGLAVLDKDSRILALSENIGATPPLAELARQEGLAFDVLRGAILHQGEDNLQQHETQSGMWFARRHEIRYGDTRFTIIALAPASDFSGRFGEFQTTLLLLAIIGFLTFLPVVYVFAASMSRQIKRLGSIARHVQALDFDHGRPSRSRIVEFDNLLQTFREMSASLKEKTGSLQREREKLARLVELGISMAAETDNDRLLEMILKGAKELTNADGGTIYMRNNNEMQFEILLNNSLGLAMGGTSDNRPDLPNVPLFEADGLANHHNVVSHAVHQEMTVNIRDAYEAEDFDFSGTRRFDTANGYRSRSFLTVPLKPRGGDVIGALQIINAIDKETGAIISFDDEMVSYIEALAAQAATALYNRELILQQREFMDSLIHLLAGAIDAKSPYTGVHCERMPLLARMLAEKAVDSDEGDLAGFKFTTDDEWREFEIAAWLHDCGKIVTPEYVIDKAAKLETLYNRIHEIRTRFEVLLRDAEIDSLKSVLNGLAPDEAATILVERQNALKDDFAFLANSNLGTEFMSDEDHARLQNIAKHVWVRHLDPKLGMTDEERARYDKDPTGTGPAQLLEDQPWQVIDHLHDLTDHYKDRGFNMVIPEHLYNRGELHNLSVRRGTLTAEERFKINEHIVQTIDMLEQLPLPPHLRRVPEYAGAHHETIDGKGYPRNLTGDDLSIPARIMAIADVFEALTSADRPYKKPKTLSESLGILHKLKTTGKIDPELFDLFLSSGVCMDYAHEYLLPEQVDDVDLDRYLNRHEQEPVC